METSSTPPSAVTRPPARGTFYHLQLVIGVAFILATLFTAWTPGGFIQGDPAAFSPSFDNPPLQAAIKPTNPGITSTPRARPLIGIVIGHWQDDEKDPGAVCENDLPPKLTELTVNQNIAAEVQKTLLAAGLDVVLLAEFDDRLTGFEASALVSIHADSCAYINEEATGFKVAAAMANPHPERSARLTACLRSRYAAATNLKLHSTSITPDMTSYHAFEEISENTPAAIIETGFLHKDRELLERRPDVAASGISDGILCYINNEDLTVPLQPTATP